MIYYNDAKAKREIDAMQPGELKAYVYNGGKIAVGNTIHAALARQIGASRGAAGFLKKSPAASGNKVLVVPASSPVDLGRPELLKQAAAKLRTMGYGSKVVGPEFSSRRA